MKPSNVLKAKHVKEYNRDKINFGANYQVLMANENEDSPFFPDKDFLGLAERYWGKSNSIEDFLNNLQTFVINNIGYKMQDPKENSGHYLRNASEVYKQRKGICSERAFLMVSLARIAGIEAKYGVPAPYSNYEHGIVIVSSKSGLIAVEPCGKSKYHNLGYVNVNETYVKNRFQEWRNGNFNNKLGR